VTTTLVLVETSETGVAPLSQQAMAFARRAAAGDPVHAVVVGDHPAQVAGQIAQHGAGDIHHVSDPRLDMFAAAAWAAALAQVATSVGAGAVVAAGTARGHEVLAHLAARADAPMAAGCVQATPGADGGPWQITRQIMGGAVLEELTLSGPLVVLSVAPHAVPPDPAAAPSSPAVTTVTPQLSDADLVAQVRAVHSDAGGGADLAGARVVVGGGRGVGGPEGFDQLIELARLLGGTIGVSRVVTSQGWRPHHEQVGQTGTKIAPDLYVACGISGAIQHWAGCQSAKTILAINTDADAPMVTRADYAVIGDLHQVVPAVLAELKRRTA
jgi:electron transfer flavoprotein alpha subunit